MASEEDIVQAKLQREYSQFEAFEELKKWLKQRTSAFRPAPHRNPWNKAKSQFARWLVTIQVMDPEQLDDLYPLMPRALGDRSKTEFVNYYRYSFPEMTDDEAAEFAESLQEKISQFLQLQESQILENSLANKRQVIYTEKKGHCRLIVGKFQTPHSKQVMRLVQMCGELSAALVCLRYHNLNDFAGCESSPGPAVFDALYNFGGVRYEGFSSPLNLRMRDRPDSKFCSLFPDTDAVYGSLGSFFKVDLKAHPGGWLLNPPHSEPVLEATVKRVVELLEDTEPGQFWFFILFPDWKDCKAWELLDSYKKRRSGSVRRKYFQPNRLPAFLDCYGRKLVLRITLCLFVVGELPDNVCLNSLWAELATSC